MGAAESKGAGGWKARWGSGGVCRWEVCVGNNYTVLRSLRPSVSSSVCAPSVSRWGALHPKWVTGHGLGGPAGPRCPSFPGPPLTAVPRALTC